VKQHTAVPVIAAVQNAEKYPPPWLIAMQRYGPPPSYPTLKIPGLTAPIPEVCLPFPVNSDHFAA